MEDMGACLRLLCATTKSAQLEIDAIEQKLSLAIGRAGLFLNLQRTVASIILNLCRTPRGQIKQRAGEA